MPSSTVPANPSTRCASLPQGRRPEGPLFSEYVTRACSEAVLMTCSSAALPWRQRRSTVNGATGTMEKQPLPPPANRRPEGGGLSKLGTHH